MNKSIEHLPLLYSDLAAWWPLLSAPEDYAEEAEFYRRAIIKHSVLSPQTMLELGSGGGNNASHLKAHFEMTLVDLSEHMVQVSKEINPECEHIHGDMRTVRLNSQFDAVFVQDAIEYMTTEPDLHAALQTAFIHTRPNGVALFAPDCVRETFQPSTDHGGHDGEGRGLRYLEWTWDPDPSDTHYLSHMVYLLRDGQESVRTVSDQHRLGLFGMADWERIITEVGFIPHVLPFEHSELAPGSTFVFVGLRPER